MTKKTHTPYHPFIVGKAVYLRGLEAADVEGNWFQWFNDRTVTKFMANGSYPNTREGLLKYYQEHCVDNRDHLVLAIIEASSGAHVGNLGLHRINWLCRRAEIGIVVGERQAWGKGYATEAVKLIVEHGFSRLSLHKIFARVDARNVGAVKMFQSAGFKLEAKLKDEIASDGKFFDTAYLSVLEPK